MGLSEPEQRRSALREVQVVTISVEIVMLSHGNAGLPELQRPGDPREVVAKEQVRGQHRGETSLGVVPHRGGTIQVVADQLHGQGVTIAMVVVPHGLADAAAETIIVVEEDTEGVRHSSTMVLAVGPRGIKEVLKRVRILVGKVVTNRFPIEARMVRLATDKAMDVAATTKVHMATTWAHPLTAIIKEFLHLHQMRMSRRLHHPATYLLLRLHQPDRKSMVK